MITNNNDDGNDDDVDDDCNNKIHSIRGFLCKSKNGNCFFCFQNYYNIYKYTRDYGYKYTYIHHKISFLKCTKYTYTQRELNDEGIEDDFFHRKRNQNEFSLA